MEELIDLYDGPAIPVLTKKEKDEERRAGGAPVTFLGRTTGVTLNGGTQLAMTNGVRWSLEGHQGLLGLLRAVFSRLTAGETAAATVAGLTALTLGILGVSAYLSGSDWGAYRAPSWGFEHPQDPDNGFGVADKLPQTEARPAVGELIGHEKEAEALPAEAPKADAPKDEAPVPAPVEPAQAPAPVLPAAVLPAPAPRLPSGGFGFGSNAAAAGGGLRDSLAPFPGIKSMGNVPPMRELATPSQRLTPPARSLNATSSRAVKNLAATAGRAMGQLKFADKESFAALGASGSDQPRQFATDAFDQKQSIGGALSPISGGGLSDGGTMGPIGSGAPDLTQPAIGPTQNQTPYQNQVDNAKQGIDMAKALTLLGLALLAAGAAALAYGKKLMATPLTLPQGKMLMALGAMLMAAGIGALIAGQMMKQDAQNNGNQVAQQSGQKDQGNVINQCADQAVMPQSCNPPAVNQPGNSVHQSVVAESTAGFDLQGGGHPINN